MIGTTNSGEIMTHPHRIGNPPTALTGVVLELFLGEDDVK